MFRPDMTCKVDWALKTDNSVTKCGSRVFRRTLRIVDMRGLYSIKSTNNNYSVLKNNENQIVKDMAVEWGIPTLHGCFE